MRKKVFSIAPWIVGSAILALPVVAQESSSPGGIFQGLYEAIVTWFASTTDDLPGLEAPTAGHPIGDEPELGPYTMPGGLMAPGDLNWSSPFVPPGGNPFAGYTPEMSPMVFPGG